MSQWPGLAKSGSSVRSHHFPMEQCHPYRWKGIVDSTKTMVPQVPCHLSSFSSSFYSFWCRHPCWCCHHHDASPLLLLLLLLLLPVRLVVSANATEAATMISTDSASLYTCPRVGQETVCWISVATVLRHMHIDSIVPIRWAGTRPHRIASSGPTHYRHHAGTRRLANTDGSSMPTRGS